MKLKKIVSLLLCISICLIAFACDNNESPTGLYGPFQFIGKNVGLGGVELGDLYDEVKNDLKEHHTGKVISEESGDIKSVTVHFDSDQAVDGIRYNALVYTAMKDEQHVADMAIDYVPAVMDEAILCDISLFQSEIDGYFKPYRDALEKTPGFENCLVTKHEKVSSVSGEEVIFDYGKEIYTIVYVDGQSVPVKSRAEVASVENGQVFEISFITVPLTQSYIDCCLSDDSGYVDPATVSINSMTSEMFGLVF